MVKAFMLVETAVGRTLEVVNALRQVQGVKSVDTVTGPYDAIAILETDRMADMSVLVTDKIGSVPGITRTVICLALKGV